MRTVKSWAEVPSFTSEDEESDFWANHELSNELLAEMKQQADPILPIRQPRNRGVR